MAQSHICRKLYLEGSLPRITTILSQEQFDIRSDLGRRICQEFRFFDSQGRPQLTGCLKTLSQLETTKGLPLPVAGREVNSSITRKGCFAAESRTFDPSEDYRFGGDGRDRRSSPMSILKGSQPLRVAKYVI